MQNHGFDEYISEYVVSLNRSLPDRRDEWCKDPANIQVGKLGGKIYFQ